MANEEVGIVISVLQRISIRGRRVEDARDAGSFEAETTPAVTIAELQRVSSLSDDSSDSVWASLEGEGTTFSELAKCAATYKPLIRVLYKQRPLLAHQLTECVALP